MNFSKDLCHAFVIIAISALSACGKQESPPAQASTSQPAAIEASPVTLGSPPTSMQISEAVQSDRVELTSETDPTGLAGLFFGQVFAIGKGIDMAVDQTLAILLTGALADAAGEGSSRDRPQEAFKSAYIANVRNGTAIWEGRSLPASLVTVEIKTVDKAAGKYGRICFAFAALRDAEFDYLRSPMYSFCDEKEHAQRIVKWESETHFQETSQFGKR